MDMLIWTGTAISLVGVAGLLACVFKVMQARRAGLDDDALRTRLKRIVIWNMAALMVSAIGLMAVIAGILLG